MSAKGSNDGFQATADEMNSLEQAMKDPKFRDLLAEYAKEISDPANRARNEQEIKQMEMEQGNDVKFINPEPGFVVKTTLADKVTKVFINVAESDTIDKPVSKTVKRGKTTGTNWSLPHSTTTHREDTDKKGDKCLVYDAVFHPQALRLAKEDGRIKDMLVQTSLDGIEKRFPIHKFDRDNLKFPKMKFKGNVHRSMIREKKTAGGETVQVLDHEAPSAMDKLAGQFTEQQKAAKQAERATKSTQPKKVKPSEPTFSIVHRGEFDMMDFRLAPDANQNAAHGRPKELVVTINLPKCVSAAPVELDISAERITLVCEKPGPYRLDTALPYEVDQDNGKATFDKSRRALIVTLPVLPPKAASEKRHAGILELGDDDNDNEVAAEPEPEPEPEAAKIEELPDSEPAPSAAGKVVHDDPDAVAKGAAEGRALFATSVKAREKKEMADAATGKQPEAAAAAAAEAVSIFQAAEPDESESEPMIQVVGEPESVEEAAGSTEVPTIGEEAAEKERDGKVPFTCHQTEETLSIVLEVAGITDGSVEVDFTEHKFGPLITHSCTVSFDTSVDEFVGLNQLVLRFDAAMHPDGIQINVSADNTVIVLNKATPGVWRRLRFGPSLDDLSEHTFPAMEVADDGVESGGEGEGGGAWTTDDNDADVVVVSRSGDEYHAEVSGGGGGAAAPAVPTTPGSFQASPKYVGSKPGYFFTMGDAGLGYYPDNGGGKSAAPGVKSALKKKPTTTQKAMPGLANIFNNSKTSNGIFGSKTDGSVDYDIDEDEDDEPKFVELPDDNDDGGADVAKEAVRKANEAAAAAAAPAKGFPVPKKGVTFSANDEVKEIPAREKKKPMVSRGNFTDDAADYPGLGGTRQKMYDDAMAKQQAEKDAAKKEEEEAAEAAAVAARGPVPVNVLSNELLDELE